MKATIIDYETTDANPSTCIPVQTGLLQFDLKTWEILDFYKKYHLEPDAKFSPEAIAKCGITTKKLVAKGIEPEIVAKRTYRMLKDSDIVIAHNGLTFDFPILDRFMARFGKKTPQVIRFDSMKHIDFPAHIKTRALLYLCAEHNFLPKEVVPGGKAHDAGGDCYALHHLLSFYRDQMKPAIAKAENTIYTIEACVDRSSNHLAKARQYRADYVDNRFNGWFKDILACDLETEFKEAGFKLAYEGKVITKVVYKDHACKITTSDK